MYFKIGWAKKTKKGEWNKQKSEYIKEQKKKKEYNGKYV